MHGKNTIQALLESMEVAAEKTLQHDAAFHEALQGLKWEIDNAPRVKSAIHNLRSAGQNVQSSFVPEIRVKIKTNEGLLQSTRRREIPSVPPGHPVEKMAQELRDAATDVIRQSRFCRELDRVVNEAVAANASFQEKAAAVERAGFDFMISLDLSAYAHLREASGGPRRLARFNTPPVSPDGTVDLALSGFDRDFLRALKISADETNY